MKTISFLFFRHMNTCTPSIYTQRYYYHNYEDFCTLTLYLEKWDLAKCPITIDFDGGCLHFYHLTALSKLCYDLILILVCFKLTAFHLTMLFHDK